MIKIALVVLCVGVALAQDGRQASAGPISDLLNSVGAPKIGYAPGIRQAVSNTGAQPNPFNLIPGFDGRSNPLQSIGGLTQGFTETGGQLFRTAFQPFQQLAQGLVTGSLFNFTHSSDLTGGLVGRIANNLGPGSGANRHSLVEDPTQSGEAGEALGGRRDDLKVALAGSRRL